MSIRSEMMLKKESSWDFSNIQSKIFPSYEINRMLSSVSMHK